MVLDCLYLTASFHRHFVHFVLYKSHAEAQIFPNTLKGFMFINILPWSLSISWQTSLFTTVSTSSFGFRPSRKTGKTDYICNKCHLFGYSTNSTAAAMIISAFIVFICSQADKWSIHLSHQQYHHYCHPTTIPHTVYTASLTVLLPISEVMLPNSWRFFRYIGHTYPSK